MKQGVRRYLANLLHQADSIGRDALLATREAELLGGGGLDAHLVRIASHDIGEARLHGGNVRVELRALGAYGGVDVDELVALGGDKRHYLFEDDLAVHAQGVVRRVGKW